MKTPMGINEQIGLGWRAQRLHNGFNWRTQFRDHLCQIHDHATPKQNTKNSSKLHRNITVRGHDRWVTPSL